LKAVSRRVGRFRCVRRYG